MAITIVKYVGPFEHPSDPSKGMLCQAVLSQVPDEKWKQLFYAEKSREDLMCTPRHFTISGDSIEFDVVLDGLDATRPGTRKRYLESYVAETNAKYDQQRQTEDDDKRRLADWHAGREAREAQARRELES